MNISRGDFNGGDCSWVWVGYDSDGSCVIVRGSGVIDLIYICI